MENLIYLIAKFNNLSFSIKGDIMKVTLQNGELLFTVDVNASVRHVDDRLRNELQFLVENDDYLTDMRHERHNEHVNKFYESSDIIFKSRH